MLQMVHDLAEWAAGLIELLAVAIITLAAILSLLKGLFEMAVRRQDRDTVLRDTRHRLINGILLGIEFLVAADIIQTVVVDLTFSSVGTLALIVLIRTFLTFTLELEMTGRWPWQSPEEAQGAAG